MSESTSSGMDGKTISIISYLTLIGWIVALVMNQNNKDELASFHIRQMLGLMILSLVGSVISMIMPSALKLLGTAVSLGAFVLWILAFIGAIGGEKKLIPLLGEQFQEWFKGVG
ncbi:MAG: hypothetical protein KTR13_07295 [Saprospiraceae bacterium]|nr:hypothetical protein [Saprospiraceae bacterium]